MCQHALLLATQNMWRAYFDKSLYKKTKEEEAAEEEGFIVVGVGLIKSQAFTL